MLSKTTLNKIRMLFSLYTVHITSFMDSNNRIVETSLVRTRFKPIKRILMAKINIRISISKINQKSII